MIVAHVELIEGPLPTADTNPSEMRQSAGAIVVFDGVVRPVEEGKQLSGLHYQSYEPMTTRMLTHLANEIIQSHSLIALAVSHSIGHVPINCCSFRLTVFSAHRKEALAGMDEFIDRMKKEVPLWKVPVWA